MKFNQKLGYLNRSILNVNQQKECPFCGSQDLSVVDRKYLFTSLLKCSDCKLKHRHPKDDEKFVKKFYQSDYEIDCHMITKMPVAEELEALKRANFPDQRSYEKDIAAIFKDRKEPLKIVDYGCSWGYDVFKLNRAGHDAVGFEISVPRADYGAQNLGVTIHSSVDEIPHGIDLMFSSHVIEHLTDIKPFIEIAKSRLTPEGIFMVYCPNGSEPYMKRDPHRFHVGWGAIHPNYLSMEFAQYLFRSSPYLIQTGDNLFDHDLMESWDGKKPGVRRVSGWK